MSLAEYFPERRVSLAKQGDGGTKFSGETLVLRFFAASPQKTSTPELLPRERKNICYTQG